MVILSLPPVYLEGKEGGMERKSTFLSFIWKERKKRGGKITPFSLKMLSAPNQAGSWKEMHSSRHSPSCTVHSPSRWATHDPWDRCVHAARGHHPWSPSPIVGLLPCSTRDSQEGRKTRENRKSRGEGKIRGKKFISCDVLHVGERGWHEATTIVW